LPQQQIPLAEIGQRLLELDCCEEQWRQIIVGVGALHLRRLLYPLDEQPGLLQEVQLDLREIHPYLQRIELAAIYNSGPGRHNFL